MNKDFLPENYKAPEGNYYKLKDGENTFRVLSSAITGYEYWSNTGKPIRSKDYPTSTPDIRIEEGSPSKIKHFWAFTVWNYDVEKVQILEITQVSIMSAIKALVDNKKWGSPKDYDLTITREGAGFDTTYQVMPNPKAELPQDVKERIEGGSVYPINLEALYSGLDPFAGQSAD